MPSSLAAVISGLINSGQSLPTVDVQNLLQQIQGNQQGNTSLINQMPAQVQQLLQNYQSGTNNAANTYTGTTGQIGQNLLNSTQNLYGPNTPAVQATLAALKQQDYSTLPGTLTNLKSNLAATGGLQRGGAANAITKATLAPAQAYSQQGANVTSQQLQAQQQNVQQALNKIASMDDATAQSVFGMSVQQATQILQSGNQATQTQLADLINSNNLATNQSLNVQGLQDQNAYNNAVTRNAQQAGIVNGLVNLGVQGAGAAYGAFGSGGSPNSGGQTFDQLNQQGLVSTPPPGSNYAPPGY
jgi:hypothetical protein